MKKLTLNKACQEKWENMAKNKDGRFCDSCSKTVMDFSSLSGLEILQKMKVSKEEVCGRLTSQQLVNPIPYPEKKLQFEFPYPNLAASLLLAAALASNTTTIAQNNKASIEYPIDYEKASILTPNGLEEYASKEVQKSVVGATHIIKGTIKKVVNEETKHSLNDAIVTFITLTKIFTTISDKDGNFQLEIPEEFISDKNVIYIDYKIASKQLDFAYFEDRTIIVEKAKLISRIEITEEIHHYVLGGLGFMNYKTSDPLVFSDGVKIPYKKYENHYYHDKEHDAFTGKQQYSFYGEAAKVIYGDKVDNGLHLFFSKK